MAVVKKRFCAAGTAFKSKKEIAAKRPAVGKAMARRQKRVQKASNF
jgi:hypothetical protein